MFLSFLSEDVGYHINCDSIRSVQEIGDLLTVFFIDGTHQYYEMVSAPVVRKTPRFDYWQSDIEAYKKKSFIRELNEVGKA